MQGFPKFFFKAPFKETEKLWPTATIISRIFFRYTKDLFCSSPENLVKVLNYGLKATPFTANCSLNFKKFPFMSSISFKTNLKYT